MIFPTASAPHFMAEVSSNHNRDLERCRRFFSVAKRIGCTAVKFQLFQVNELFAPEILQRSPAHRARADWELPPAFLPELRSASRKNDLLWGLTPFSLAAVKQSAPFVDFFKVASYELLWHELLAECAGSGLPLILSTGMATFDEVAEAVEVVRRHGCQDLTVLHCVSAYPTPVGQCNLSAIETLRTQLEVATGWSDHTTSPAVIYRAVHAWLAEVVEFHLDLDREGSEFSGGHNWLPDAMAPVIRAIREGLSADGDGTKKPVPCELSDRDWRADPRDGLRPLQHVRDEWKVRP